MNNKFAFFALSACLFIFSGCAAPPYVQGSINLSQSTTYSRVLADSEKSHDVLIGLNEIVMFTEVDGNKLTNIFRTWGPEEINILPGQHTIRVKYSFLDTFAEGCLELNAKPGTNYVVRKRARNYSVMFWLETMDGNVVGNLCGFGQE